MEEARKQITFPNTEEQEWAEYNTLTRTSVSDWILDTFGERCEEVEETCIVCQKWKLFDQLFEGLP